MSREIAAMLGDVMPAPARLAARAISIRVAESPNGHNLHLKAPQESHVAPVNYLR